MVVLSKPLIFAALLFAPALAAPVLRSTDLNELDLRARIDARELQQLHARFLSELESRNERSAKLPPKFSKIIISEGPQGSAGSADPAEVKARNIYNDAVEKFKSAVEGLEAFDVAHGDIEKFRTKIGDMNEAYLEFGMSAAAWMATQVSGQPLQPPTTFTIACSKLYEGWQAVLANREQSASSGLTAPQSKKTSKSAIRPKRGHDEVFRVPGTPASKIPRT